MNPAKDIRMTGEYQRAVDGFVRQHLHVNASTLVHNLSQDPEAHGALYLDELSLIWNKDDWLEPALDAVDYLHIADVEGWLKMWPDNLTDNERRILLFDRIRDGEVDAQELCDNEGIEPHTIEALEHWIVSDWLARKLEEKGEMVSHDIHGLSVWGRATTGQAISIDGVICDIYDEL